MKEYKGWEIIKMLDEKKLKLGDELTLKFKIREEEGEVNLEVYKNLLDELILKKENNETLESSYLCGNSRITLKPKAVSFFEAVNSNKKLRITDDKIAVLANDRLGYKIRLVKGEYLDLGEITWCISNSTDSEYVRDVYTSKCWLIEED